MTRQRSKSPSEQAAQKLTQDSVYQTMISDMRRKRQEHARATGRAMAALAGAGFAAVYLFTASLLD